MVNAVVDRFIAGERRNKAYQRRKLREAPLSECPSPDFTEQPPQPPLPSPPWPPSSSPWQPLSVSSVGRPCSSASASAHRGTCTRYSPQTHRAQWATDTPTTRCPNPSPSVGRPCSS